MSLLRNQAAFAPFSAHNTAASFPHSTSPSPERSQKMSITQTYRLAHRARGKLSSEASRGDHDLRLLVGHANLLDSLMLDLQDAERQQEAWFEQTVYSAPVEPKVQFADRVYEQHTLDIPEPSDDEASDSEEEEEQDSDDEMDIVHSQPIAIPRRTRARSPPPVRVQVYEEDQDTDEDDSMEDDDGEHLDLALVRTASHTAVPDAGTCPELVHDSSDESDDEGSIPSSPTATEVIVKDFAVQQTIKPAARLTVEGDLLLPPSQMVEAY